MYVMCFCSGDTLPLEAPWVRCTWEQIRSATPSCSVALPPHRMLQGKRICPYKQGNTCLVAPSRGHTPEAHSVPVDIGVWCWCEIHTCTLNLCCCLTGILCRFPARTHRARQAGREALSPLQPHAPARQLRASTRHCKRRLIRAEPAAAGSGDVTRRHPRAPSQQRPIHAGAAAAGRLRVATHIPRAAPEQRPIRAVGGVYNERR